MFMLEMPTWKWWEKIWPWGAYHKLKRLIARLSKTKWKLPMVRMRYPKIFDVFKEE